MQTQGILIACFGVIFGAALWLAHRLGSKAARLEAQQAQSHKEKEEQQRAQKIMDHVYSLPVDDARRRLHDVANKQC